jgi:glucokinase-like ROK family protein
MVASKLGAAGVRERNLSRLLNIAWGQETISRADISRVADLSRSTVSDIVNDLLRMGLVKTLGAGDSRGGRKPILLGFEDDAYLIVGADMGATHISIAVTDLGGNIRAWRSVACPIRSEPERVLEVLRTTIAACLASIPHRTAPLVGIGVAVPCPVDLKSKRLSPTVLPEWDGIDIAGRLQAAFQVPVFLDNDANLGALAELWWDPAHRGKELTYIKLGTGIGAGHILSGEIYRGSNGVAGELGHIAIDLNGPLCACGLRGCLTTFVGAKALVARVETALRTAPSSRLSGGTLDVSRIAQAAVDGDPVALQVVGEAGRHLGSAVASLVNLLNPGVVVIGGALSRAGELLLGPIRAIVQGRAFGSSAESVEITTSQLGERAIALGAATLVLQAALANPTVFPATRQTLAVGE